MSIIKVTLINAVLSHDTSFFTSMDPYCILRIGSDQKRSGTRSKAGKNVSWGEVYRFNSQDHLLKVFVFNQNIFQDDLIGEGSLDISRFRAQPFEEQVVVELNFRGKIAGRVQLEVMGEGQLQTNTTIKNLPPINVSNSKMEGDGVLNVFYHFMGGGNQVPDLKQTHPKKLPQRKLKRVNSETIEEGISSAFRPPDSNQQSSRPQDKINPPLNNTLPQKFSNSNPFEVLLQNTNNNLPQNNLNSYKYNPMGSPQFPLGGPGYNNQFNNRPYNGWN